MKTFYVYYEGRGYGCDYTIGCNLRVEVINAESAEEVWAQVKEEVEESPTYAEERIESVTVIEAAGVTKLDIEDLTRDIREQQEQDKKAKKEAEERAEYERLKKKFE